MPQPGGGRTNVSGYSTDFGQPSNVQRWITLLFLIDLKSSSPDRVTGSRKPLFVCDSSVDCINLRLVSDDFLDDLDGVCGFPIFDH
jgi:hypothetical protein